MLMRMRCARYARTSCKMGVQGLWAILSPAGQSMPLSRLAGKTLAVDLSGWICQALTTKGLVQNVPKPHLRNLFFRVSAFYRLGASLVFVVDGEATHLKWATLDKRVRDGPGEGPRAAEGVWKRSTGRRPQLQRYVRECCSLLDCLGVPYLQSKGEAEALCSLLNSAGLTDGVLTNDSDTFLYGAETVYRDVSTTERSAHVECYTMQAIEDGLALSRRDLVAMALLLGCDYCPEGVVGVGREKTLKFIGACKSHDQSGDLSRDALDMFRQWRSGQVQEADLPIKIECEVFRKAMASENFPNEEIISEFLVARDTRPAHISTWRSPHTSRLWHICHRDLNWEQSYSQEKVAPILTQWAIRQSASGENTNIHPEIVKSCRRSKEPYYQVQWSSCGASSSLERDNEDIFSCGDVITLELQEQMEQAFPSVCASYRHRVEEEKRAAAALKEQAKALAKQQRQEQRAAMKKKSRKKTPPPPDTPTLPQVLQRIVLKTPPKVSSSVQQLASLHTSTSSHMQSQHTLKEKNNSRLLHSDSTKTGPESCDQLKVQKSKDHRSGATNSSSKHLNFEESSVSKKPSTDCSPLVEASLHKMMRKVRSTNTSSTSTSCHLETEETKTVRPTIHKKSDKSICESETIFSRKDQYNIINLSSKPKYRQTSTIHQFDRPTLVPVEHTVQDSSDEEVAERITGEFEGLSSPIRKDRTEYSKGCRISPKKIAISIDENASSDEEPIPPLFDRIKHRQNDSTHASISGRNGDNQGTKYNPITID